MLPGSTRSPKIRFCRASKSGSLNFFGLCRGGGDRSAMTLPFLMISTCSPPATHSRTLPKLCRNCLTFAVFMFNKHVIHHSEWLVNAHQSIFSELHPRKAATRTLLRLYYENYELAPPCL